MPKHTYKSKFTTEFEFSQVKSANTSQFTVLYIHGLYSNPWGAKPEMVKKWCQSHEKNFFRFELAGHGSDIKNYEKADINIWKEQVLEIIDNLIEGKIVMCGASVGGWLSLLAARERPERIKGVIGLAAAPDFTEELYLNWFSDAQKEEMDKNGKIEFTNNDFTYVFTKKLIESGRQNLLLTAPLKINCPVQLIQGQKDASLEWHKALKISDLLTTEKVVVKLLKDANHRLHDEASLKEICCSLDSISKQLED